MLDSDARDPLAGAWRVHTYVVGGEAQAVNGLLLLVDGRWSTLYFVPREAGDWASAEAGRYTATGDRLSFYHQLMFQGGAGADLRVTQTATHVEACAYELDGTQLAIHFPSGNTLHLERSD